MSNPRSCFVGALSTTVNCYTISNGDKFTATIISSTRRYACDPKNDPGARIQNVVGQETQVVHLSKQCPHTYDFSVYVRNILIPTFDSYLLYHLSCAPRQLACFLCAIFLNFK